MIKIFFRYFRTEKCLVTNYFNLKIFNSKISYNKSINIFPIKFECKLLLIQPLKIWLNSVCDQQKNRNLSRGSKIRQKLNLYESGIPKQWYKTNKAWWYCKLLVVYPGLAIMMIWSQNHVWPSDHLLMKALLVALLLLSLQ